MPPFVHMINGGGDCIKLTLKVNCEPVQGTAKYVW